MNREQRRAAQRGQDPKDDPQDVEQQQHEKLHQPGTPQDVADTRAKNQRHGKVTADKWNQ